MDRFRISIGHRTAAAGAARRSATTGAAGTTLRRRCGDRRRRAGSTAADCVGRRHLERVCGAISQSGDRIAVGQAIQLHCIHRFVAVPDGQQIPGNGASAVMGHSPMDDNLPITGRSRNRWRIGHRCGNYNSRICGDFSGIVAFTDGFGGNCGTFVPISDGVNGTGRTGNHSAIPHPDQIIAALFQSHNGGGNGIPLPGQGQRTAQRFGQNGQGGGPGTAVVRIFHRHRQRILPRVHRQGFAAAARIRISDAFVFRFRSHRCDGRIRRTIWYRNGRKGDIRLRYHLLGGNGHLDGWQVRLHRGPWGKAFLCQS